ncbi:MAG: hypothetical protein MI866_14280 [Bacteroidales bacterium]|nr:hypothetical protein [Bacteroidales bacterium]
MLIALLIKLLFGGGTNEYLIPSIEKYSKKNLDKEANMIVCEVIKEHRADTKLFYKTHRDRIRNFHKTRKKKDIDPDTFEIFLQNTISGSNSLDSLAFVRRQTVRQQFTKQQWDEAVQNADKDLNKYLKKKRKQRDRLTKRIDKFKRRTERLVNNRGVNPNALAIVNQFEALTNEYLDEYGELELEIGSYLRHYHIDEEILNQKMDKASDIKKEFYSNFKKTYFELIERLTEEEWRLMRRQFNRI